MLDYANPQPDRYKVTIIFVCTYELFVKQDAEARMCYLSNTAGQDTHTNSGRKQRSLDFRQRIKFVIDSFESMPRSDYISTIADDLQRFDN